MIPTANPTAEPSVAAQVHAADLLVRARAWTLEQADRNSAQLRDALRARGVEV